MARAIKGGDSENKVVVPVGKWEGRDLNGGYLFPTYLLLFTQLNRKWEWT